MPFRIGQKVICINDTFSDRFRITLKLRLPVKNQIYIIRDIHTDVDNPNRGVALIFHEFSNPIHSLSGKEYGFYSDRFRPLDERKTDISFAHEILRKVTKRKTVDA